jgi:hypothetical protein
VRNGLGQVPLSLSGHGGGEEIVLLGLVWRASAPAGTTTTPCACSPRRANRTRLP